MNLFLSPSGGILAASWPAESSDDFTLARQWLIQRRSAIAAGQPLGSAANTGIDGFGPYWDAADNVYFRYTGYLEKYTVEGGRFQAEQIHYAQRDQETFVDYKIDHLPTTIDSQVYFLSGVFNRNVTAIPINGGEANVLHRGNARNRQWVLSSSGDVIAVMESPDAQARFPDGPTVVSLTPQAGGARVQLAIGERFRFFPPISFDLQRDREIMALSNRNRRFPALVSLNLRSGRERVLAAGASEQMAAAVSRDGRHWYWTVSETPLPTYRFSAEAPQSIRRFAEGNRLRTVSLVDQSLDGSVWLLRAYSPASGLGYRTFAPASGELAPLPTVCDDVLPAVDLMIDELPMSGGYEIRSLHYRPINQAPDRPLVVYLPGGPFEHLSYVPNALVSALLGEGFSVVALQYPQRTRHDPRAVELPQLVERGRMLVARSIERHASQGGGRTILVGESFGGWLGLRLLERHVGARDLVGVASAFALEDMQRAPQFSADWQGGLPWSPDELALEINRWPPGATAVFVHGERDGRIPARTARAGVEALTSHGLDAELILRPRMHHRGLAPNDWETVLREIAAVASLGLAEAQAPTSSPRSSLP